MRIHLLKAKAEDQRTALEKLLVNACEKFYTQVRTALGGSDPGSFAALTQDILDNISANGGELTKEDGCIYWYQNSLNYYYYEIRHDNAAIDHMEYGKYGVVRNNYYTLTLTKVNGNGTPWYPGVVLKIQMKKKILTSWVLIFTSRLKLLHGYTGLLILKFNILFT